MKDEAKTTPMGQSPRDVIATYLTPKAEIGGACYRVADQIIAALHRAGLVILPRADVEEAENALRKINEDHCWTPPEFHAEKYQLKYYEWVERVVARLHGHLGDESTKETP